MELSSKLSLELDEMTLRVMVDMDVPLVKQIDSISDPIPQP